MPPSPTPVILDVDTGVDDALALLLAATSPHLNLIAVTCVHGNVTLDQVVPNTLNVLHHAGRTDVPVAAGLDRPLVEPPRHARGVHGDNGIGGLELPTATRTPEDTHAVEYLRRTILDAQQPITLVPLAPLTNIATLLTEHPEVKANIERIVFMGGAIGTGNASASAEFNVRQDPEAADIVVQAGIPTTMYGLDVFHQVAVTRPQAEALVATNRPAAELAGRLLLAQMQNYGRDSTLIGDAGALASVIEPNALTTSPHPVRVELDGAWTRGQTVVDQRPHATADREEPWQPPMNTTIHVATHVDHARYQQLFLETVTN
ncbi:MAG: nucleoside hydrolase [Dehalococcoidia bacterium]|jgi:pyrimidine-specific ribonucleoside hydrolase|nr:nucleoside hydrolase [Dehalococcoidia bacterium]